MIISQPANHDYGKQPTGPNIIEAAASYWAITLVIARYSAHNSVNHRPNTNSGFGVAGQVPEGYWG